MANTTNLGLGKLAGTEKLKTFPAVQAGNMDAIDGAFGAGFGVNGKPTVNAEINSLADGLAIISNNNTHAAITSGQYVYVRNHGSLANGLYVATANIPANGTLSGSNLTADTSGGLNSVYNSLNEAIATLNSKTASPSVITGANKSEFEANLISFVSTCNNGTITNVHLSFPLGMNIFNGVHAFGQLNVSNQNRWNILLSSYDTGTYAGIITYNVGTISYESFALKSDIANRENHITLSSGSLLTTIDNLTENNSVVIYVANSSVADIPISTRGVALVAKSGTDERGVIYQSVHGEVYTNNRYGAGWTGWQQLALKSNISTLFKWLPVGEKIGALSAGSYGMATLAYTIPTGYKTTGITTVGLGHPGVSAGLVITVGVARGLTGEQTLYLSYYTPRAITDANSDYSVYIELVKSDYSF